jgi:ABC-2 type transport system ATP-binding protein
MLIFHTRKRRPIAMDEAVYLKDVHHSYGAGGNRVDALSGVDISAKRGEIFGFLGPNGAGKTTAIKLMLGIMRPQKGEVKILELDPFLNIARYRIGFMPETADYYQFMTPRETLYFYGDLCDVPRVVLNDRIPRLLGLAGLEKVSDRLIKTFSKGMKQKVSFAQALINDPDLLILDEPTSGLDPISRKNMRDVILALRTEGKTILFSSHELSEAELICDRIAILNNGKVLASGELADFLGKKGEKDSLERYFLRTIGGIQ